MVSSNSSPLAMAMTLRISGVSFTDNTSTLKPSRFSNQFLRFYQEGLKRFTYLEEETPALLKDMGD